MSMPQSLALIGLGKVGKGLATTLLEAGFSPLLWDSCPQALTAFENTSARLASGLGEVAAQVVILSLPETTDVENVVFSEHGLANTLQPGSIIVDMSTGMPDASARMAEKLRNTGVEMLDAPISFERDGRETQVGGPAEVYAALTPLLDVLVARHTHIGPNGHGNMAKLAKNMINAGYFVAISEAFAYAAKQGADPALLFECIKDSGAESVLLKRLPEQVLTGAFKASGSLGIHTKDLRYALEAGNSCNAFLPMTAFMYDAFNWAAKNKGADWSQYKVISLWETINNAKVSPQ